MNLEQITNMLPLVAIASVGILGIYHTLEKEVINNIKIRINHFISKENSLVIYIDICSALKKKGAKRPNVRRPPNDVN